MVVGTFDHWLRNQLMWHLHQCEPRRLAHLSRQPATKQVIVRPVRESHFSDLTRQVGWRMCVFHDFGGE